MTLPAELRAERESGERWLSVLEVGTPEYNRQKYMNALLHRAADALEWPNGVLNRAKTLEVIRDHNLWRRGADAPQTDPRMLGLALDAVVAAMTPLPATPEGE